MKSKKFWNFVDGDNDAELLLYGTIAQETWWGDEVTPLQFASELRACRGKNLTVRINSEGGDVFAAQAIHSLLRSHDRPVTVTIDGLCASAATIIACAGDEVRMPRNAIYMIHNPMVGLFGQYNAEELNSMISSLETVKEAIIEAYKRKVGEEQFANLSAMMDEETWMSAEEAKSYGLVDSIDEEPIDAVFNKGVLIVNNVACHVNDSSKVMRFVNRKEKPMYEDVVSKVKNFLGINDAEEMAVSNDATGLERNRIMALDALKTGNTVVDSIIETAKQNGSTVEDINPYLDAIKEPVAQYSDAEKALQHINNLITDNVNSGTNKIKPQPVAKQQDDKATDINSLVAVANQMRGGK